MAEPRYIGEPNKKYIKVIVILIVLIFILVIVSIILGNIYKKDNNIKLSYDNLTTIKEVIEYYESKYISENPSDDNKYYLDVYLTFRVLPYNEKDESNEEYYNNLLGDCAKILNYRSFKMLDEQNNLTVEVICDGSKIKTIIINGIEDYFIYMDSQLSMKKFKDIKITEFNISSELLQNCINNNWNSNISFGERDSIYDDYYIFFDEGIKVKIIDNRIYNIVFDKKYSGNVINNIFPGMALENIEVNLGEPTFKDDQLKVIGYKGKEVYAFFTESEISVYRLNTIETDDFFNLADKYIKEEIDFKEFMNELTYLWPDYSDYKYTSNSVFISYPLKGIEIKLNYDNENGIFIFNNIKSSVNKVERYIENTDFVAKLQLDLVFEAEKRRIEKNQNLLNLCKEYKESLEEEKKKVIGESLTYDIYPELDNNKLIYAMNFISKFGEAPNRQLSDTIDSFLWANNNIFIYSKKGKGIYLYNLDNGIVSRVLTGTEDYELKGFENGILKFDDTEVQIQY